MSYFSGVVSPAAMLRGAANAVWHGSGASTLVGGAQQVYQNSGAGGTWGGMARGAARMAVGGAALATLASAPVRSAAATGVGLAIRYGGAAAGLAGGAYTMAQNMRAGGTWGGVAQGAVQMATGGATLSAMHAPTTAARAVSTAVSAAGTFINDFATAAHERSGMTQDTRMLRGGLAAHRVPLEAVSIAIGGSAGQMLATGSSVVGNLSTAASMAHHASQSDSYFNQARSAASRAWNMLPSLR